MILICPIVISPKDNVATDSLTSDKGYFVVSMADDMKTVLIADDNSEFLWVNLEDFRCWHIAVPYAQSMHHAMEEGVQPAHR